MRGENNISILLREMRPEMEPLPYVFVTSTSRFSDDVYAAAIMRFREIEGETLILPETAAKNLNGSVEARWAKITLAVNSALEAVGFLAAILPKLAEAGISVNPVSAYFHDHLFVPWDKRELAMTVLQTVSNNVSRGL